MHFSPQGESAIKALGLRQRNPETLRWTAQHSQSNHGLGVLLRGKSGELLDGRAFKALHDAFGARIECDSINTKRRVENALVTVALGLDDAITIADVGAQ